MQGWDSQHTDQLPGTGGSPASALDRIGVRVQLTCSCLGLAESWPAAAAATVLLTSQVASLRRDRIWQMRPTVCLPSFACMGSQPLQSLTTTAALPAMPAAHPCSWAGLGKGMGWDCQSAGTLGTSAALCMGMTAAHVSRGRLLCVQCCAGTGPGNGTWAGRRRSRVRTPWTATASCTEAVAGLSSSCSETAAFLIALVRRAPACRSARLLLLLLLLLSAVRPQGGTELSQSGSCAQVGVTACLCAAEARPAQHGGSSRPMSQAQMTPSGS